MRRLLPPLAILLALTACEKCNGGDDTGTRMGGVGDDCIRESDCRLGLVCEVATSTCQPAGTGSLGTVCTLTGDCLDGLYCAASRTCETAGMGEEGADCASTADCARELVCLYEGFGGRCRAAGTGDLGDACGNDGECLAGLTCTPQMNGSTCASAPPVPVGDGGVPPIVPPYWGGEECEEAAGDPEALFRVPREGLEYDFYSLPYPNDVRRVSGGLNLTGHPAPGTALPIDIIDRYLRASEQDLDGFSLNPVIFFRFSHPYDWESMGDRFRLVDITLGSPTYGETINVGWFNTFGRVSKYVCENWFAMRTLHGHPLRPDTTYAAVLETGITASADSGGAPVTRADDLDVVLGDAEPMDAALRPAWNGYAPLRAWLADASSDIDAPDVLNAAVFTTQRPTRVTSRLRDVIRARETPALSDLTVCDTGVTSPCDDGTEDRACSARHADYVEIHGRIELPIFQEGTLPYESPEDGGGIAIDASGLPIVQRTENVCFAMTVPRAAPPPEGYPLVIVGHGTGGSFTGGARGGLAAEVANAVLGGTTVQAATLSIDFPEHGERRGGSTRSPEVLFFNFANPRAARDNIAQGAADLLSLVHFATSATIDAASSPTMEEIRFDPARIAMYMHSQGSTHASLMIGYEPDVSAIVLSGNGGDLTLSLLNKTEPVDIAGLLPFALLDPARDGGLVTGDYHPALSLFQAYFDSVDPVNYATLLHREPVMGVGGHHVFMTYGPGDSYSPEPTMQAYSIAAPLTLVRPLLGDGWRLPEADAPLSGNVMVDMTPFTMGLRQYDPTPSMVDGHFVALRTDEGRADVRRFLLGALAGAVPEIGAP
jgi:hypothetical protein